MTRPMSADEQRAVLLDLLGAVDTFCHAHGLRYQLYAGTLIGALRHGGFIPWDDDLDVMMPRADYEKFCATFPREGDVYLASSGTHRTFPYAYAKVCRAGTVMREPVRLYDGPGFGVNVDVIPYDVVPRTERGWARHRRLAMAVRAVLLAKVVEPSRDLPPATRLGLVVAQALLRPVPTRWLTAARTRVATLLSRRDTGHLGMLVASVPWRVEAHHLATTTAGFETVSAPVPTGASVLLSEIYGDFMQLPPESARVAPHPGRASWTGGER